MDIKLKNITLVYGVILLIMVVFIDLQVFKNRAPRGGSLGNNQNYTITLYTASTTLKSEAKNQPNRQIKAKRIEKVEKAKKIESSQAIKRSVEQIKNYKQSNFLEPLAQNIIKKKTSLKKENKLTQEVNKESQQLTHSINSSKAIKLLKGGSQVGLNGQSEVSPSYQQKILIYLQNYRYYPPLALRRHISGTASVHLQINCDGSLVSYKITRSAGNQLLDDAVIKMLKDAGRLPMISHCTQMVEMTLPIEFKMV